MAFSVSDNSYVIRRNGIEVIVAKWSTHKKPVLAVRKTGGNVVHKVASFNSTETANWFLEQLFGGNIVQCRKDDGDG